MNTVRMVIKHVGARSMPGQEPAWCCVVCEDPDNEHGAMVLLQGDIACMSKEYLIGRELMVERPEPTKEWPKPRSGKWYRAVDASDLPTMRMMADLLQGMPREDLSYDISPGEGRMLAVNFNGDVTLTPIDPPVPVVVPSVFAQTWPVTVEPDDPVGRIMRPHNAEDEL